MEARREAVKEDRAKQSEGDERRAEGGGKNEAVGFSRVRTIRTVGRYRRRRGKSGPEKAKQRKRKRTVLKGRRERGAVCEGSLRL